MGAMISVLATSHTWRTVKKMSICVCVVGFFSKLNMAHILIPKVNGWKSGKEKTVGMFIKNGVYSMSSGIIHGHSSLPIITTLAARRRTSSTMLSTQIDRRCTHLPSINSSIMLWLQCPGPAPRLH